jgi:hypothetical protein
MKNSLVVFMALLLSGCWGLAGYIPSVQSCQYVDYKREYSEVEIHAICDTSKSGTVKE